MSTSECVVCGVFGLCCWRGRGGKRACVDSCRIEGGDVPICGVVMKGKGDAGGWRRRKEKG